MGQILSLPESYSREYLRTDRVFPLIDNKLQDLIDKVNTLKMRVDDHNFIDHSMKVMNLRDAISRDLFDEFKRLFQQHVEDLEFNYIVNLNQASRIDICSGCTQYIDSLYMRHGPDGIQVLEREYTYHKRLNPHVQFKTIDTLVPGIPLIISQPFYYGKTHAQMTDILNHCENIGVPVHIDGAWITACKNINLDFGHPAIKSVAISMSKGYGLSGWNRIGLRWTKEHIEDAITIMNDYVQVPAENVSVGLYFLKNVEPNHLWSTHRENYDKICKDFNLTPTDSIHLAMDEEHPVGVEALLRYLESEQ